MEFLKHLPIASARRDAACFEEAEAAVALAKLALQDGGTEPEAIRRETLRIRRDLCATAYAPGGQSCPDSPASSTRTR